MRWTEIWHRPSGTTGRICTSAHQILLYAENLICTACSDVSRTSNIIVSAYLRTAQCVQGQDDMGNDLLMGRVEISPILDAHHVAEQWYTASVGSGEFHLTITFRPSAQSLSIEAFDLLKVIGKGSFGKVMQVRKKDTQRIYALKTIRKAHIASRPGEITHILAERTVLALVNNPFIVPLKFSFQNPDKLYLVMSFGGFHLMSLMPQFFLFMDVNSQRWRAILSSTAGGQVQRKP